MMTAKTTDPLSVTFACNGIIVTSVNKPALVFESVQAFTDWFDDYCNESEGFANTTAQHRSEKTHATI